MEFRCHLQCSVGQMLDTPTGDHSMDHAGSVKCTGSDGLGRTSPGDELQVK